MIQCTFTTNLYVFTLLHARTSCCRLNSPPNQIDTLKACRRIFRNDTNNAIFHFAQQLHIDIRKGLLEAMPIGGFISVIQHGSDKELQSLQR